MPKQIIWSPLAERDFTSVLDYLKNNWDDKVVRGFIDITEEILLQILNHPQQFPLIHKKK